MAGTMRRQGWENRLRMAWLAAAAAIVCAGEANAQFQSTPTSQSDRLSETRALATADALIVSAHQATSSVSRAIAARLAPVPAWGGMPPALAYAAEDKGSAWPGMTEGRSADTPAALLWNVWADANASWIDRDHPLFGNDGYLTTSSIGIDRRIGDRAVLGVVVNGEWSDLDTTFTAGKLETKGLGIGAYGGYALTDRIVADALVLWKGLESDVSNAAVRGSYASDRWIAAANLTGYLDLAAVRLAPSAGILWTREEQGAYIASNGAASPGTHVETAVVSLGTKAEYTLAIDAWRSVTPWLGLAAEWEVAASDGPLIGGARDGETDLDVRLSGGVNGQVSDRLSVALKADLSGLARSGHKVATAGAQVALRF